MERLTLSDYGRFKIPPPTGTKEKERPSYMDLYCRLAAIEDILGDEYDLDRLRELAQADREGRCVVLPCKIGGPVWRLYDDCDFPGDCYTKQKCRGCEYRNLFIEEQAFCLSMLCQNGKLAPPYYTIRAEAEAALRREQDGNNK